MKAERHDCCTAVYWSIPLVFLASRLLFSQLFFILSPTRIKIPWYFHFLVGRFAQAAAFLGQWNIWTKLALFGPQINRCCWFRLPKHSAAQSCHFVILLRRLSHSSRISTSPSLYLPPWRKAHLYSSLFLSINVCNFLPASLWSNNASKGTCCL